MPRVNAGRSIDSEVNVARRVSREREKRGMSYETLAKKMSDAGCTIASSALFKIEKGHPPRRVTVDELVAFSRVFDLKIEDLLTPVELLDQHRAQSLVADLADADERLVEVTERYIEVWAEFYLLAADSPELFEYARNHRLADGTLNRPVDIVLNGRELVYADADQIREAMITFVLSLIDHAASICEAVYEIRIDRGTQDVIDS